MTYISPGEQGGYGRLPSLRKSKSDSGVRSLPHKREHTERATNRSDGRETYGQPQQRSNASMDSYQHLAHHSGAEYGSQQQEEFRESFFRYRHPHELPYQQRRANETYIENQLDGEAIKESQGEVLLQRVDLHA